MTTQRTFCYQCGARMEPGTRFCPECGAASQADGVPAATPSPTPTPAPTPVPTYAAPRQSQIVTGGAPATSAPTTAKRPSSTMLLGGVVAVVAIAAAVFFLVLNKDDSKSGADGGSGDSSASTGASVVSGVVKIGDLSMQPPKAWKQVFEEPSTFTFALNDEDLASGLPKGPKIQVTRHEIAEVDYPAMVTNDVDSDDQHDPVRNGVKYGNLTGSEVRIVVKTSGEPDVIERHLYVRGRNVFGPAFDIITQVPAAMDSKYNGGFTTALNSMVLKNDDNP